MRKAKKGQMFMVLLAVITLLLLIVAYTKLTHKYAFRTEDGDEKLLGDLQYALIDKYADAEAYMFYLDQAAKYSLDLAIYHLAEHGGYYDDRGYYEYGEDTSVKSPCGNYNGYEIWATPDKECYPDYQSSFISYFNLFYSKYLAQFDIEDPYFEIEFSFIDDMINLIATKNPRTQGVYRKDQKPTEVLVAPGRHNEVIQGGIKALQIVGSGIRPISGSAANNYANPGMYTNFASVKGPYSVHVDRKNRIMVVVNSKGEIAAAAPINIGEGKRGVDVLATGNVANSHVTPTGTYKLRKESTIPNGNSVSFGINGVWRVMEPKWRGVLLHGGRNADSRLVVTYGCIRIPDSMIIALNNNLNSGATITIT